MKKLAILIVLLGMTVSVHAWDGTSRRATSGRKTVSSVGTAVQLSTTSVPCQRIYITALTSDVGMVNVGGSNVLASSGVNTGTPLAAGESVIVPLWDLSETYIDATVANEGVTFTCYQ